MPRSLKKGYFQCPSLTSKLDKLNASVPIKTWSRSSTVSLEMVGRTFLVHNGKVHVPVHVSEQMLGHKLGEFAPTRSNTKGHEQKKVKGKK
jgi:small subunit ribosomal protein S19